jgi:hypothetical protein
VDSALYFILGDWILIVWLSNHITKNIKVVIGNEALVQYKSSVFAFSPGQYWARN